ncbi:(2Fe-2S)-binding protein [Xanthobacter sp. KR7-65]|uniref:(2Fe-2S)-binding protein n=1 Tax=Xanthobacter sp. KR7-65 TaxID=3156612 RepID=UPI0032B37E06
MASDIAFRVNGIERRIAIEESVPLIHVLRNELDLKATRFGCGEEQCGACMVLLDGQPAYACTLIVGEAAGRSIETAEVLADGAHPLRAAFLEEQAGQCGYCLSGILLSAKALLDRTASPTRAEIIAALEPHLCRCGAQGRMVRAVERAAASLRNEVAA